MTDKKIDKLMEGFLKEKRKVAKDNELREEDIYCKRCGNFMSTEINKVISFEGLARVCDKCRTFTEKLGEKIKEDDKPKRFSGILRTMPLRTAKPIKLGGITTKSKKKKK